MIAGGYAVLPQEYRQMTDSELIERIEARKAELGKKLVILTHHYQRRQLVALGDYRGDSYGLCKIAAGLEAEYIIFCGVHFMAESAEVLSRPEQKVFLPNPLAGCPMADMASIETVLAADDELRDYLDGAKIVPISYMNSTVDLKAFCGRNGGLICTSSNATEAFKWALDRGDKLFFFPDEHLGRNTANTLGIRSAEVYLWDFNTERDESDIEAIRRAKVILWKGYCHVHTVFKPYHIAQMRKSYPLINIVVHPECTQEVAGLADSVGSTAHIVKYVEAQPVGSAIAIGTELNLVERLAHDHPDKRVLELAGQTCAMCVNMYRTTLNDLTFTLENLDSIAPIAIPEATRTDAGIALERMLAIGG